MPRKHSSHRRSVGFLEAFGQWAMGPESSRRSSRRDGRPHRHTDAYRQARLDDAPPGLNLTARQWREYVDYVPAGYCTDEENENEDDGREEVRQSPPPVPQPEPDPFRSAWSHSPSSVVTRAHGTVRRRDSPLDRILGRTSVQESCSPQLRDEVSFDANNDPLFANVPHFEERRDSGHGIVHQERASNDGPMTETFGQHTSATESDEHDQQESEASAQSLQESQFFSSPRRAPRIQQTDPYAWPSAQNIHSRNRAGGWRNTAVEVPQGQYRADQEPSVFGGSHVTVWPGPDQGSDAVSLLPGDSATQIAMRRYGQDSRGSSGSGAGHSHSGSSRTGGSRDSRRRH